MPEIPFPRGVRDLMPNEALFRNELLKAIEGVFQRFGFLTIDTPTFESLDILLAKNAIGDENKLIYTLKEENLGLRYDHTVSLARYYSMHQELPLPFKRYYIGKAWRREEPQKNRYREFTQADIDIIGGKRAYTDCEVIATAARALEALGIAYCIKINDRRITDLLLAKLGIGEQLHMKIYRIIDKLEKVGSGSVARELSGLGLQDSTVDQIISAVSSEGSNSEKLSYAESVLGKSAALEEFSSLITMLGRYNLKGTAAFDLSLVRGLDYYTSTVFEFESMDSSVSSSIAAGGRYDKLIGLYSGKSVPAVGISLGIDRIMDLLGFRNSLQQSYTKVIVNYISEQNFAYALEVAEALRSQGINTEVNLASRNITNQLAYANSLKIPYAITIGSEEEKLRKVKLRNLTDGSESLVSVQEASDALKKG